MGWVPKVVDSKRMKVHAMVMVLATMMNKRRVMKKSRVMKNRDQD